MRDPKMRKDEDGVYICAIPDCGKPLNDVTVKNADPFCSTGCANLYYDYEPTFKRITLGGAMA